MSPGIDTVATLERFEAELGGGASVHRREFILEILRRWLDDADLTPQSRQKALELLKRYG